MRQEKLILVSRQRYFLNADELKEQLDDVTQDITTLDDQVIGFVYLVLVMKISK